MDGLFMGLLVGAVIVLVVVAYKRSQKSKVSKGSGGGAHPDLPVLDKDINKK